MKNFDIKYEFKVGDKFIALKDIKFNRFFIAKGTVMKITSIGFNSLFNYKMGIPQSRRTDIFFDVCGDGGCFIYCNEKTNLPTYYHNFKFSEIAKLKEIRNQKLNKLNNGEL